MANYINKLEKNTFLKSVKSLTLLNTKRSNTSYLFSFKANHLIYYPTPITTTYAWSFGFLAGMCLVTQMISGIFLAMHYTPHLDLAFSSVESVMFGLPNEGLFRYLYVNGILMFFIASYFCIFRVIYSKFSIQIERSSCYLGSYVFFCFLIKLLFNSSLKFQLGFGFVFLVFLILMWEIFIEGEPLLKVEVQFFLLKYYNLLLLGLRISYIFISVDLDFLNCNYSLPSTSCTPAPAEKSSLVSVTTMTHVGPGLNKSLVFGFPFKEKPEKCSFLAGNYFKKSLGSPGPTISSHAMLDFSCYKRFGINFKNSTLLVKMPELFDLSRVLPDTPLKQAKEYVTKLLTEGPFPAPSAIEEGIASKGSNESSVDESITLSEKKSPALSKKNPDLLLPARMIEQYSSSRIVMNTRQLEEYLYGVLPPETLCDIGLQDLVWLYKTKQPALASVFAVLDDHKGRPMVSGTCRGPIGSVSVFGQATVNFPSTNISVLKFDCMSVKDFEEDTDKFNKVPNTMEERPTLPELPGNFFAIKAINSNNLAEASYKDIEKSAQVVQKIVRDSDPISKHFSTH